MRRAAGVVGDGDEGRRCEADVEDAEEEEAEEEAVCVEADEASTSVGGEGGLRPGAIAGWAGGDGT